MNTKVEIEPRNKGVPGVNVTVTFANGKSIYRAVVPAQTGTGWLVVNSYSLYDKSVEFSTQEAAIEHVKNLTV